MKVDKNTGVSIGVVFACFGIFSWFNAQVDKKVDKVEAKTEVNKEEIDLEENINIQQSEAMIHIQQNQLKFIKEFEELQKAK